MKQLASRFFRGDLDLGSQWWHRLLKVLFVLVSFAVLVLSSLLFYETEGRRAVHYVILKDLGQFNRETKAPSKTAGSSAELTVDRDSRGDWEVMVVDTFLDDENFAGGLGCAQPDGTVQWVSKEEVRTRVNCNAKGAFDCFVPRSVCGGDASRLVKYTTFVRYGVANYARIAIKVLAVFFAWFTAVLTTYYRGLIYVIYGRAVRAQA